MIDIFVCSISHTVMKIVMLTTKNCIWAFLLCFCSVSFVFVVLFLLHLLLCLYALSHLFCVEYLMFLNAKSFRKCWKMMLADS